MVRHWGWGFVVVAGCSQTTETTQTTTAAHDIEERAATAPTLESVELMDETGTPRTVTVRVVDGRRLFEGDIEIPARTLGASVQGRRWPGRIIPYVVDPALPYPSRIDEAIAEWEARTAIRFTVRTTQSDYVRFVPGRGCSSPMGRIGGPQDIVLETGERLTTVVGADFLPSTNRAHYWYRTGLYSVGRSMNVDEYEVLRPFTVPAGERASDIVEVAIAPNDAVYAWYADGKYSIGTPQNLGATQAPAPFTLPASRSTADVVGIAIASNGRVRAWYADGTTSEGTPSNLAAWSAPVPFVVATGQSGSDLVGVGMSNAGTVYAWYGNAKKASGGTITSLGATYAPYDVTTPGWCDAPATVHEIGHAAGLYHEQTRSDRDAYITINWTNIGATHQHNFQLRGAGNDWGPYDFASIMHYDSYAFSTNGQPTIVKKDGTLIGTLTELSAGDVAAIASMYP